MGTQSSGCPGLLDGDTLVRLGPLGGRQKLMMCITRAGVSMSRRSCSLKRAASSRWKTGATALNRDSAHALRALITALTVAQSVAATGRGQPVLVRDSSSGASRTLRQRGVEARLAIRGSCPGADAPTRS
jgi:hypothetical protein